MAEGAFAAACFALREAFFVPRFAPREAFGAARFPFLRAPSAFLVVQRDSFFGQRDPFGRA